MVWYNNLLDSSSAKLKPTGLRGKTFRVLKSERSDRVWLICTVKAGDNLYRSGRTRLRKVDRQISQTAQFYFVKPFTFTENQSGSEPSGLSTLSPFGPSIFVLLDRSHNPLGPLSMTLDRTLTRSRAFIVNRVSRFPQNLFRRIFYRIWKAVDVQFYMTLMQLIELNEREQYLTTSVMMTFTWKDEYMTWRPEMNGGITEIIVPSSKIWVPDVLLYNRYYNHSCPPISGCSPMRFWIILPSNISFTNSFTNIRHVSHSDFSGNCLFS